MVATFQSEKLQKQYLNFIHEWNTNKLISVRTSGSTGEAKEIHFKKEQLILSATKTINFFNLSPGTKALLCLSMNTIAGKMMIARSIVGNWNLHIKEAISNPLCDSNEAFDFAAFVPIQIQKIIEEDVHKLKEIKTIIVGGAPISPALENLLKLHKITAYQTFGMTETVSHIALRKIGFDSEKNYTTLNGISVSEIDDKLIIHYPEMQKDYFLTNDIVRIISTNQFEWLGRADFIINSGGVKLNPELIEQKLTKIFSQPFFITGIPDEKLGTKLALVIENFKGMEITKHQLIEPLEKFELPKVYTILDSFIKTESGKINRIETLKKIDSNNWEIIS